MKLKIFTLTILLSLTSIVAYAQSIDVTSLPGTTTTAIENFFEASYIGLDVLNVSYTGHALSVGMFDQNGSTFPLDSGLILSTG